MKTTVLIALSAAALFFPSCTNQEIRSGDSHLNDGNRANDGKMLNASEKITMDQKDQGRVRAVGEKAL